MTRIASKPVTQRQPTFRDLGYRKSARGRVCDVEGCSATETVVLAHMRVGNEGGMGLKPDDRLSAFLCVTHHQQQESARGYDWWAENILKVLMRERYEIWRREQ